MRAGGAIELAADDGFVDGDAGRRLDGLAEKEEKARYVDKRDCVLVCYRHLEWLGPRAVRP